MVQVSDSDYTELMEKLAEIRSIKDESYREFRLRRLASTAKVGGVSGLRAISKLHFEPQGGNS